MCLFINVLAHGRTPFSNIIMCCVTKCDICSYLHQKFHPILYIVYEDAG